MTDPTPVLPRHVRDFVGYGAEPPHPRWPHGARLALNFCVNYEEGSEPSIPDGDPQTEQALTEGGGGAFEGRDLAAESMYEYGSRVGFWRVARLLRECGFTATLFGCALALERNPAVSAAVRELGWYCRYGPSLNTRRLVMEEGGFLYDSHACNDELTYWVRPAEPVAAASPHLVVPYSLVTNDAKFMRAGMATGQQYFEYLRDTFDVLYSEGLHAPRMMSVGLHLRVVGHPGRAVGLARFLDHVAAHPDVWVCQRSDIARHWHEHHPSAGA